MEKDFSILNGKDLFLSFSDYSKKYNVNLTLKIMGAKVEKRFEGDTIEDALYNAATWYINNQVNLEMIKEIK